MNPRLEDVTAAFAGRYRVERQLGQGGMATVWLAHDPKHGRQVAIKVLHPHLAAVVGAERFLKEIRTTATLQHPHILPLFDSGEAEGLLYYVMPFVDGESLRDRLKRDQQLSIPDAVRIAGEIAGALDYAHRQGVIHRDIKPENILLHDGQALVADFGIAIAPDTGDTRLTETGLSIGTPSYMSPEQALGERNLDARTDVYATGAVLYEMLTGAPPFSGASAQAIVAQVISAPPAPPSRRRRDVPVHLDAATLTALAKNPDDRFATGAALQAGILGTEPARMPGSHRRNVVRGVVVAFGFVAIAVIAVLRPWAGRGGTVRAHVPDTSAVRLVKQADAWQALRRPSSCDSAIAEYSEATLRDSLYAPAFGGLGQARALCAMYANVDQPSEFAAAQSAIETALRLDPGLAVAYTARGMVQLFGHQDYVGAQRSFVTATQLDSTRYDPWLYKGWCYVGLGKLDSAVAVMRRAHALVPTEPIVSARLATALLLRGDTAEALVRVNELLQRDSLNGLGHAQRLEIFNAAGRCDDAMKEIHWVAHMPNNLNQGSIAYAWGMCGQPDRARKLADSLAGPTPQGAGFGAAVAYAGLGDSVRTFAVLNSLIDRHNALLFFLGHYFAFARYHGTKAFDDVLARAHVKG